MIIIIDNNFTVASYNILAENVCFKLFMNYCPYPAINFSYRKVRIVDEIKNSKASIICL